MFCLFFVQKLRVLGRWEAYRYNDSNGEEKKPRFRVKNAGGILKGSGSFGIEVMGCGRENKASYKIEILKHPSVYRIMDMAGGLVAQVMYIFNSSIREVDPMIIYALETNTWVRMVVELAKVRADALGEQTEEAAHAVEGLDASREVGRRWSLGVAEEEEEVRDDQLEDEAIVVAFDKIKNARFNG